MALTERLQLDLTDALRGLGRIDESLERSARSFRANLQAALDPLSNIRLTDIDAREVTRAIDSAVESADLEPEVLADADQVTEAIDEAVAAADTEPVIEADASAVTDEIDDAVAAADAEVPVDADVGSIASDIEAAVAGAEAIVSVDADTSEAVAAIEDLGSTAEDAGSGVSVLEGATSNAGAAAGVATGDFSGLGGTLEGLGGTVGAVATGLGSLAVATGVFFNAALEADTAGRRFDRSLGDMADSVRDLDVGNLNEDLSELALRTGNSDEALQLAAARLADLGRSADAGQSEILETTEAILGLSIRATTLNPTLGQAGQVADQLTNALARGGRALVPYGLAISAAEIEARALEQTGKRTAAELTIFDKASAGAGIATQRLGKSLKEDINAGAEGAEIRLRSLRERVGELAERLGAPLLEPVLAAFEEAQPIIEDVGEGFGELAQVAVPLLVETLRALQPVTGVTTDLLSAVAPVLRLIVDLVEAIPDPVLAGAAAFVVINKALGGLSDALGAGGTSAQALGRGVGAVTPLVAGLGAATLIVTQTIAENNRVKAENAEATRRLAEALRDESTARAETLDGTVRELITSSELGGVLSRLGLTYSQVAAGLEQGGRASQEFASELVAQARASGSSELEGRKLSAILTGLATNFQNAARAALDDAVAKGEITAETLRAASALETLDDGTVDYLTVLGRLLPQQADLIAKHGDAAGAAGRQADAEAKLTDEINKQIDALLSLISKDLASDRAKLSLRESVARVTEAQAALTKAIRDNGASSDEAAEAQRRLDSAQLSQREAAVRAATAQAELKNEQITTGSEADKARLKQLNLREAFLAVASTLEPGSNLRVELEGYARDIAQKVPTEKHTEFSTNAQAAGQEVATYASQFDLVPSNVVTGLTVERRFVDLGSEDVPNFMAGGDFGPHQMFIAGDPGPNAELVVAGSASGHVFTRSETVQILAEALRANATPVAAPSAVQGSRQAPLVGQIVVNEVANDPEATAFAVAARMGRLADR